MNHSFSNAMRLGAGMLGMGCCLFAQSSAPSPTASGAVTGVEVFIHAVSDLDKSVAFYHDVLGLEVTHAAGKPAPSEAIQKLSGIPGGLFRSARLKLPESGFELGLTEYTGVERKSREGNMWDPGAPDLLLRIRDEDATLAALKNAGVKFVSTNGVPVKLGQAADSTRTIFVRDPDGFLLEVIEASKAAVQAAPGSSPVISASIGITVSSMDKALPFYNGLLGFGVQPRAQLNETKSLQDLVGTTTGGVRSGTVAIAGTPARITIYEFQGMNKTPMVVRPADPGAPVLTLIVKDLAGLLSGLKAAGGKVLSSGGPITSAQSDKLVFVQDPDGFTVELIQRAAK